MGQSIFLLFIGGWIGGLGLIGYSIYDFFTSFSIKSPIIYMVLLKFS